MSYLGPHAGITFGNYINLSAGLTIQEQIYVMGEELGHVTQYASMGFVNFLGTYIGQGVMVGFNYNKIPLEIDAKSMRFQQYCPGVCY